MRPHARWCHASNCNPLPSLSLHTPIATHLGLVHVLLAEASGVQHGLRCTLALGLGDAAGDAVKASRNIRCLGRRQGVHLRSGHCGASGRPASPCGPLALEAPESGCRLHGEPIGKETRQCRGLIMLPSMAGRPSRALVMRSRVRSPHGDTLVDGACQCTLCLNACDAGQPLQGVFSAAATSCITKACCSGVLCACTRSSPAI